MTLEYLLRRLEIGDERQMFGSGSGPDVEGILKSMRRWFSRNTFRKCAAIAASLLVLGGTGYGI